MPSGTVRGVPICSTGIRIWKPVRGGSSLATHVLAARSAAARGGRGVAGRGVPRRRGRHGCGHRGRGCRRLVAGGGPAATADGSTTWTPNCPTSRAGSAVATRPPELAARDAGVRGPCHPDAPRAWGRAPVSRSDFVIHGGEPFFLELNTMPGISAVSNVTECACGGGSGPMPISWRCSSAPRSRTRRRLLRLIVGRPADHVRGGDALVHQVRHHALGGVLQVVAVVHPDAGVVGHEGDVVGRPCRRRSASRPTTGCRLRPRRCGPAPPRDDRAGASGAPRRCGCRCA